jgi:hypothetical protein
MSQESGHVGKRAHILTTRALGVSSSACLSRGQRRKSMSHTTGLDLLALGVLSLAIILWVALGLRQAAAGTWPHTGLVVVTHAPDAAAGQAESASPAGARSETRESDLSIAVVHTVLHHRNAVEHRGTSRPGSAAIVSQDPHDAKWHYSPSVYHATR